MYSSLDKIDIIYKDKEGTIFAEQTDHRTKKEINNEIEYSIVFGIARAQIAKMIMTQTYKDAVWKVAFSYKEMPPQKIIDILSSLGAEFHIDNAKKGPAKTKKGIDVDEELDAAMDNVGKQFAEQHKLKICLEDTKKADDLVLAMDLSPEKNETDFWETVIGFAAFAGLVLKKEIKAEWKVEREITAAPPFVFFIGGNEAMKKEGLSDIRVYPAGKVMKLINNGAGDSVRALLWSLIIRIRGIKTEDTVITINPTEAKKEGLADKFIQRFLKR